MNDANVQAELSQPKWKSIIKHLVLGKVIFRLAAGFLSSGSANNELYRYFGVPDKKLIPFGYSMVHQILLPEAERLQSQKGQIRNELGIQNDGFVILFCGRFIKQKGLYELLEAFQRLERPNKNLVFVGGGELEQDLKDYVTANDIKSVHFFGFQSRKDLPKYYAMSDVLVLPSWRETWGMVVNEALCFGLPVIVSDQVGAAPDLIKIGSNGYTFPYQNVKALTCSIDRVMNFSEEERSVARTTSQELITNWSNRDLVGPLISYLHKLLDKKSKKDPLA
jgi:glycosyltransferase involved in cell wall biosynthesis